MATFDIPIWGDVIEIEELTITVYEKYNLVLDLLGIKEQDYYGMPEEAAELEYTFKNVIATIKGIEITDSRLNILTAYLTIKLETDNRITDQEVLTIKYGDIVNKFKYIKKCETVDFMKTIKNTSIDTTNQELEELKKILGEKNVINE